MHPRSSQRACALLYEDRAIPIKQIAITAGFMNTFSSLHKNKIVFCHIEVESKAVSLSRLVCRLTCAPRMLLALWKDLEFISVLLLATPSKLMLF